MAASVVRRNTTDKKDENTRSLLNGVLNVPMCHRCPTCSTCPRALRTLRVLQVYFTDWKIKKILCTHTFLTLLSLILDLSLFSGTHRRKITNRIFLLQETYFLQQ